MAALGGIIQRGRAGEIARIDRRAARQQQIDHLEMAGLRGMAERAGADPVPRVDRRALIEQLGHKVGAVGDRPPKTASATLRWRVIWGLLSSYLRFNSRHRSGSAARRGREPCSRRRGRPNTEQRHGGARRSLPHRVDVWQTLAEEDGMVSRLLPRKRLPGALPLPAGRVAAACCGEEGDGGGREGQRCRRPRGRLRVAAVHHRRRAATRWPFRPDGASAQIGGVEL